MKDFKRIRDYMREFFVYGFKSRAEYDAKSVRSYDNERRRIESWLGDCMSFHRDASGKNIFISVDSRAIPRNPLYKAFKAKTFTATDVTLHFFVLDILAEGVKLTLREILERIDDDYLSSFDAPIALDESTLRKKLREYENLGLISSEKSGRQLLYSRADVRVNLNGWKDAAAFFSEADPLGVVGSYLLDKYESPPDCFRFKHHYVLHAMESEILYELLEAIDEKRRVELKIFAARHGKASAHVVVPLKIYISTQNGRRYLLAYNYRFKKMIFYRLDSVKSITFGEPEPEFEKYRNEAENFKKNLWRVAIPARESIDHIEIDIRVENGEEYILNRLEREKRNGKVTPLGDRLYSFTADIFDAVEMLPWIRTFIGRIAALRCDNKFVEETFFEDLKMMEHMYEVDGADINVVL
jgi:DNA-binding transcriptional ArsR family regulator